MAPVIPHAVTIDRTAVMKVRSSIQEHIANDRPMSVKEEWTLAHEQGEEFQAAIWSGLTTPERDYVRKANTPRK